MPDTGEKREIRQRINAKEAERASEAKKLSHRLNKTRTEQQGRLQQTEKGDSEQKLNYGPINTNTVLIGAYKSAAQKER